MTLQMSMSPRRCDATPNRSGAGCSAKLRRCGSSVCRMHGAGGGAPKGNRNALKHGNLTAETLALKREIHALARMTRATMGAIDPR
jgi:hypothetical protein